MLIYFFTPRPGPLLLCVGREKYDIDNDEGNNYEVDETLPGQDTEEVKKGPSKHRRLASLDAVRGLNMAIMVLVDEAGSVFPHISHSPWNNITFADLVMPWSVYAVRACAAPVFVVAVQSTHTHTYMYISAIAL